MASEIGLSNFLIYFLIMNTISFTLFAWDKQQSRKGAWRIEERNLLLSALLGGSLGALLGMYTLRHKTRHLKFRIGIPLILVVQVILVYYMIKL